MTVVLVPIDDEDLPILIQALRDQIAIMTTIEAGTVKIEDIVRLTGRRIILRKVVAQCEGQIKRMAGRILAEEEKVQG